MSAEETPRRRGRPSSGGREAILEAALAVVRQEGVAKLTSREVAARAGVSDASVYYHFGDRDGLLRAVFAHGLKPLTFLEEGDPPRDLSTLLAAALASLERFFDEVLPVMTAAQSDSVLGAALARYTREQDLGPHRGVQALGRYLAAEQADGRVHPDADPEAVAMMVIDTAYARSLRRLMLTEGVDDARLPSAERMLAQITRLLEPPRA